MEKAEILKFLNKFQETTDYYLSGWMIGTITYKDDKKSILFFKIFDNKLFLTSINQPFDYSIIDRILIELDAILIKEIETSYTKIPFSNAIKTFDHFLFAGEKYHTWFKSFDKSIHSSIVWFNPIHHCEFTGLNPEEFKPHNMKVDITNWQRTITPLILVKLHIPNIGIIAKKTSFYDKEQNVFNAIKKMRNNECWLEIENAKMAKLLISYDEKTESYNINKRDIILANDLEALESYIHNFLIN